MLPSEVDRRLVRLGDELLLCFLFFLTLLVVVFPVVVVVDVVTDFLSSVVYDLLMNADTDARADDEG